MREKVNCRKSENDSSNTRSCMNDLPFLRGGSIFFPWLNCLRVIVAVKDVYAVTLARSRAGS